MASGTPAEPASPSSAHLTGYWKRRCAALFRWLHIYLSMASFGILFFFAVTGLTLNHADWLFGERPVSSQRRGELNRQWVAPGEAMTVAKLEVVEHLRRVHGVKGLVGEFRIEDGQCALTFKGPGYTADAIIDRGTGAYELNETRLGFIAIINDLHKGRDTGPGWSIVVDLSALLMVFVSMTGMVLIYFVRHRFVSGVVMAILGALVSCLAYVWLVP